MPSYVTKCSKLERNDLDGSAVAYRETCLTAPSRNILEDEVGILYMMHLDTDALDRRLNKVSREPAVAAALRRLGIEP